MRVGVTDLIDAKVEHFSLERLYNSHLQSAVDNALRSTDGIPIRAMEKDLKAREATINSMVSLIDAKDVDVSFFTIDCPVHFFLRLLHSELRPRPTRVA